MVHHPAASHDGDVHVRLRHISRNRNRRHTAAVVLHGRHHAVELFLHLLHLMQRRLRCKRRRFRKSIFPPPRRAPQRLHEQPHPHADTVGYVHWHIHLLCLVRAVHTSPLLLPSRISGTHCHDRTALHGMGTAVLILDNEIPRPEVPHTVRHTALHVCHPGHLSSQLCA